MSRTKKNSDDILCSFCGKTHCEVKKIITGSGVFICNECVDLCCEILENEMENYDNDDFTLDNIKTPSEIKDFLDDYIISQDDAKKTIAVAVYNHYKRIKSLNGYKKKNVPELQKSNILLLGPTGSGKTLIAQTIARMLDVPFAIADATSLTEAGYVGEDVENVLLKLIQDADYDIDRAEKGIIYIDEIDKLARKGENVSITRDVSGEGVQQALLKIIEGTVASVPPQGGRKHPHQELVQIDTSNILFICGGAFNGLDNIIKERDNKKIIGFNAQYDKNENKDTNPKKVQPQDVVKYGLIPEFIGRLPIIATLDKLDEKALTEILTKPKNSIIKQYQYLLELDGVKLEFEKQSLKEIANIAIERETGARGLRAILEELMRDIMFEIPSRGDITNVKVTKEMVRNVKIELPIAK